MIKIRIHPYLNMSTRQIVREDLYFSGDEFANEAGIVALVEDYLDEYYESIKIQYADEEDWTLVSFYDLLEEIIPESHHCHRWGLNIYKFDNFYIIANPDHDIVEVFHD